MDDAKKQELLKKVGAVIEYIRPYLQADGGDIKLIDITDDLTVKVKLTTGREILGEVIRFDRPRDVAVVKAEESGMIALPIRDSEPGVGEEVYAIGAPLDEEFSTTMTKGIVSGYRTIESFKYIQSDVNVLPGNSGGPLLDKNGNVVGISCSGVSFGPVSIGLNFFVPIQEALRRLNIGGM